MCAGALTARAPCQYSRFAGMLTFVLRILNLIYAKTFGNYQNWGKRILFIAGTHLCEGHAANINFFAFFFR